MKFQTFSINVGTRACDAGCPYCIAKMTRNKITGKPDIDVQRFNQACSIALQARNGIQTVLFTGQGEPLLYPGQITWYLEHLQGFTMGGGCGECTTFPAFPLIELQTNGIRLKKQNLQTWYNRGLSLVCISIAHDDPVRSNELMRISDIDHNFWQKIKLLQECKYSTRLNCTLLKEGMDSIDDVMRLVDKARNAGVTQLTVREVEKPFNPDEAEVAEYVARNKPDGLARKLYHWCKMQEHPELPQIPGGGRVFDVDGQNLGVANCVTETTDHNDVRQVIFWPDGRITHSWHLQGARIR